MSWIDEPAYLGPDRRRRRLMRLIERRSKTHVQQAPSVHTLLRKLQFWATDLANLEPGSHERYCARLQVVADLAHERREFEAEACLRELERHMRTFANVSVAQVSARVQAAILALRA